MMNVSCKIVKYSTKLEIKNLTTTIFGVAGAVLLICHGRSR
jgi:hypothetical protein